MYAEFFFPLQKIRLPELSPDFLLKVEMCNEHADVQLFS
jgi:hypothetical protein